MDMSNMSTMLQGSEFDMHPDFPLTSSAPHAAAVASVLHVPHEDTGSPSTLKHQLPSSKKRKTGKKEKQYSDAMEAVLKTSADVSGAKSFPEKLMHVLSQPEISDVISWLPHGRSFVICDSDRFTKEVLPLYFKQAKFSSFTRKLYRWGFRHITKGADANSFYHELFQRDHAKRCLNMYCTYSDGVVRNKRAKGQGGGTPKTKPDTRNEPTEDAGINKDIMPILNINSPTPPAGEKTLEKEVNSMKSGTMPSTISSKLGDPSFLANTPQLQQMPGSEQSVEKDMASYLYQQKLMAAVGGGMLSPQAYIAYLRSQLESGKPQRRNSFYANAS